MSMRITLQEQGVWLSISALLGLKTTILLDYLVHLKWVLNYAYWYNTLYCTRRSWLSLTAAIWAKKMPHNHMYGIKETTKGYIPVTSQSAWFQWELKII